MSRSRVAFVTLLLIASTVVAQTARRREPMVPADSASVDSIVAALYASVSHAPDSSPDFERMRGIFLYVGMLIPPARSGREISVVDVDQWSEKFKAGAETRKEKGESTGFFEREIARRTDCFGNVCQIFSTYESRHTESDAKPFERGINSIQLVRDGKRWWIASVAWDAERADNAIPPQYLPTARP